ncbi:YifB family Mg chelatase-like AAA ATPase [Solemya velum gill symbiont]|uniref:YifB family Mg chelatase-like AAA ATPase n=1 Tax=Solemya velum gill symbiont TaxID=2340 RepID=UPI0009974F80|nr:YifB family Mg chelatase-like AAA ATPase [Solemya velum gill symbiont]OOZ46418.1 ATP-dependent protease [Solemya velum gill symbiont]OOZ47242.1 ATP-dependent protease [Solemya velum gill symbiont]OOZ52344.1 ATP-dependent protease [Solemya velum gill symbiont]OOZ55225.1 ATP-dependent protease [Solemya velum gill symbiont]OOZ57379.1 ATP-dependent protease [Solemya velum gill symbiont]
MSLAILHSRALSGIHSPAVTVEIHLANGLSAFNIVGLAEKAVQESRERVRAAIINSGFEFPARRITVNLAPADLPKEGGRFDLAIAIGILSASGQLADAKVDGYEFLGELALSGELRRINGTLPAALAITQDERHLVTAADCAAEAAQVSALKVYAAKHLLEVTAHLLDVQRLTPLTVNDETTTSSSKLHGDISDVIGHQAAKRILMISAAGQHSLLMCGPPGTGKSMLASRLPGLMPPLTEYQALESASIRSVGGHPVDPTNWNQRPFRAPHHSASGAALVGGGSNPRPGEISLAHHGVLFLDELPEFNRTVLESLREPLETGCVTISRASRQVEFPAKFQLVAAMNPCHCGYLGHPTRACRCSSSERMRYQRRLSGPLLDRIDIQIELTPVESDQLVENQRSGPNSQELREVITDSYNLQIERQGKANAHLLAAEIEEFCKIDRPQKKLLQQAIETLNISHRAYHRILKLARTISDLDGGESIQTKHLSEAIRLRSLDKNFSTFH